MTLHTIEEGSDGPYRWGLMVFCNDNMMVGVIDHHIERSMMVGTADHHTAINAVMVVEPDPHVGRYGPRYDGRGALSRTRGGMTVGRVDHHTGIEK